MIEKIIHEGQFISLIVRNDFSKDGLEFFTSDEDFLQLGYMKRPLGYEIQPHVHNLIDRTVNRTQEVLFIKSGKVQIDYYDDNRVFFCSKIVLEGDVILLASGGHSFLMLEESEIIEVKQGPYCGESEKSKFLK
jgi:hypothetical protein